MHPALGVRDRLILAGVAAVCAAALVLLAAGLGLTRTDLTQLLGGARALAEGVNPYDAVGPGRLVEWQWPLYYPLPAVLLALPLAFVDQLAARAIFAALSGGLFAYALSRDHPQGLLAFGTLPLFYAVVLGQWSLLLTAAAVLPALGVVLAAKPTLGAAIWIARPTRVAALSALALVVLSLVVDPTWPWSWWGATRGVDHVRAPVLRPWGVLLLLAALRWRRPEGRLLLALACAPQTLVPYELIPLWLIPRTWWEAVGLLVLMNAAFLVTNIIPGPAATQDEYFAATAPVLIWLVYCPCLLMVLRRPNEGPLPTLVERRLPARIRGHADFSSRN